MRAHGNLKLAPYTGQFFNALRAAILPSHLFITTDQVISGAIMGFNLIVILKLR